MTNSKHISSGEEFTESQFQRTSSLLKSETDEDRGSPGFPMVSDTCSPSSPADSVQYDCDCLDFGDEGVDLI